MEFVVHPADIAFYNSGSYQLVVQALNTCSDPNFGPYYAESIYVYDSKSLLQNPGRIYTHKNSSPCATFLQLYTFYKNKKVLFTDYSLLKLGFKLKFAI